MSNTTSPDLYSSKDALLSISTFLSLKQLGLLREISKQFNTWLADYSSFSWKKRVELAFPTTFKAVLQEDVKDQITKLQKFDTLVDEGHQVSFFSLASLLAVASVEVNQKYQIPWAHTLFIIVYNKTSAMVFDAVSGKDISRVNFAEMKSIDNVLFDTQSHKVGFVNQETGLMKFRSFENNELQFVADYTSEKLKSGEEIIPQIYGDNIIVKQGYNRLAWYSLSSGSQIKELDLPGDDGVFVVASNVKPEIYASETDGDMYCIRKIDCTLQATEPMEELLSGDLGIEMDNCGDGVDGLKLIETEHGRVLHIPLLGTGDRAFQAYDLDNEEIIASLYCDDEGGCYDRVQYNPGSRYYSIKNYSDVVAIMEMDKEYEENEAQEKAKDADGSDEEEEEDEYGTDPTKGAYFKFKTDVQNYKWLNKDLFVLNTEIDGKPHCQFFSIAKRGIIGSIDEEITEDVFIAGKTIVAFTTAGDIYRIKLDMDFEAESKETENADDEKMDVVKNETDEDKDSGETKKRKSSEMDTDESDEPPKKKSKS